MEERCMHLTQMDLPQCVIHCKDAERKAKAIISFTRGTKQEQMQAITEILLDTNGLSVQLSIENKEDKLRAWMKHFKDRESNN
jgi:hypothetical protein